MKLNLFGPVGRTVESKVAVDFHGDQHKVVIKMTKGPASQGS